MPYETEDPLVSFLYQILRDCPPGALEKTVRDEEKLAYDQICSVLLSNKYLAGYAEECARRLRKAWGTKLSINNFSPDQWRILEDALDAHSYELGQKLSHEDEWDEVDLEQWKKDLDAVKALENLVHFQAHPNKEST